MAKLAFSGAELALLGKAPFQINSKGQPVLFTRRRFRHSLAYKSLIGLRKNRSLCLKFLENFDSFSSSFLFKKFENFHSSSMAPKRRAGKEVATSVAEGPSPPSVIERPITSGELFLLVRDCHLSFKADAWLSLDESGTIKHDLLLLGNSIS